MKTSIRLKPLLLAVLVPVMVGGLAGLLTGDAREYYNSLVLPAFAPPAIVFPIVWTILYLLMGFASYFILISPKGSKKREAMTAYYFQLAVNFFWSIIFFNTQNTLAAFWWLIMLIILVFVTIFRFWKIDKRAAYLMLPYMIWILFAAVLNITIYFLN